MPVLRAVQVREFGEGACRCRPAADDGSRSEGIDMRRIAAFTAQLAALAALGLSGCCYHEMRDCWDEQHCSIRAHWQARSAWNDYKHNCHHPQKKYYGRGFRDGYAAVALGGDGCCPTIPPRDCWGWCFDPCEGHQRMNAWFDGYAHGAIVAEADGVGACARMIIRRPACPPMCPTGCPTGVPLSPAATPLGGTPSYVPYGTVTPPPPAPPALMPGLPAPEAYESYDEGGLYYE
jgi:hypothetical protein